MRSMRWFGLVAMLSCAGQKEPAADTGAVEATEAEIITEADTLGPEPLRPVFQLIGTEPFWGLRIDATALTFTTPMDTLGVAFMTTMPILAGDSLRWNTLDASGRNLEAVVVRSPCSDGMSDKTWPYRARVTIAGERYEGCAERRD
jgi:uncharacterized membrane protein